MKYWLTVLLLSLCLHTLAAEGDSLRRTGVAVTVSPSRQIAMDQYERMWLPKKNMTTIGAQICHTMLPQDGDDQAADYGFPTLALGAELSLNNGVTMRKYDDPAWGKAQMVDYDSHLGDILTLYLSFNRPLLRTPRWEVDYHLKTGVGYGAHIYNRHDGIDNELIGSRFTIFFGAGMRATYRVSRDWGLTAGLEYGHHSNGALDRPNKGENHFGPAFGLRYMPYYEATLQKEHPRAGFKPFWYGEVAAGIGAKSLLEEWQLTQFETDPNAPDYRTHHFRIYAALSLQASFMYRYARRWASGLGADVFYGSYSNRVAELDRQHGIDDMKHSPWSIGLAARHEVFYHRLSLAMALGVYLYREMGRSAKEIEKPYYERIGLHYTLPRTGGIKVGANVKAHLTKADFTELVVTVPISIQRKTTPRHN